MRAMVLAAGLGTRLRPLTDELPKPVVPVGNRPLASYALGHLARFGVSEVVLNTHHLAERVREGLLAAAPAGMRLTFLHEPVLLGTGGGLANARAALVDGDEPVIVMNGDVLFEPRLAEALALHARLGAIATMVLRAHPDAARFGAVEIDDDARVRRLLGKPDTVPAALRTYMFTGVHVLSARAFADFPSQGCVIRSAYHSWIDRGEVVAGYVDETPWRDLGTPAEYLAANVELARDGSIVDPSAQVHPSASLDASIVGDGATISAGTRLVRTVVWPGAHVTANATDTIITPRVRVTV